MMAYNNLNVDCLKICIAFFLVLLKILYIKKLNVLIYYSKVYLHVIIYNV